MISYPLPGRKQMSLWGSKAWFGQMPTQWSQLEIWTEEGITMATVSIKVVRVSETQRDRLRQSPSRKREISNGGRKAKTSCLEGHELVWDSSISSHAVLTETLRISPGSTSFILQTKDLLPQDTPKYFTLCFFRPESHLGFRLGSDMQQKIFLQQKIPCKWWM